MYGNEKLLFKVGKKITHFSGSGFLTYICEKNPFKRGIGNRDFVEVTRGITTEDSITKYDIIFNTLYAKKYLYHFSLYLFV